MNPAYTSFPEPAALILWAVTATVTVARFAFCRDTFGQRHVNYLMAWGTVGWALILPSVQPLLPLSPARLYQLSASVQILVVTEALLVGSNWLRYARAVNPANVYTLAMVICAAQFWLGTPAVRAGRIMLDQPGWSTLGFVVTFQIIAQLCAWTLLAGVVRALRTRPPLPAALAYVSMLALLAFLATTLTFGLLAAVLMATGHPGQFTASAARTDRVAFIYDMIAFTPLATIPLITRAVNAVREAEARRALRRLEPLWNDLTRACPEVLFPVENLDTHTLLHRRIVEIRDAIMALAPYGPPDGSPAARLAQAVGTRTAGGQPHPAANSIDLPGGTDLRAEAELLTRFSKEWTRIR